VAEKDVRYSALPCFKEFGKKVRVNSLQGRKSLIGSPVREGGSLQQKRQEKKEIPDHGGKQGFAHHVLIKPWGQSRKKSRGMKRGGIG